MNTNCPYCREPYEIDNDHLNRKLECFNCHNKFEVQLVAAPRLDTMYLDVESTGNPAEPDAEISGLVWWCNGKWNSWVKGVDDPGIFLVFWKHAPWVVTFDGKALYEPMLCRQFNVSPHPNHVVLRESARKQGLSGGLKALAEVFGFPRAVGLENVNEETAARLWERLTATGETRALESLRYCGAWNVVLTYHLHCFFKKKDPVPMHNSIPYTLDAYYINSILSNTPPLKARKIKPKETSSSTEPILSAESAPEKTVSAADRVATPKKKIIIKKKQPAT